MEQAKVFSQIMDIVRAAGDALCEDAKFKVLAKEGQGNYVTEMDIKTQQNLVDKFKALLPQATYILEEGDDGIEPPSALTFVIDPIDGTANFIRGMHMSCIAVALLENGRPLFGCVYNPWMGEMFHAAKGEGAFCNGEEIHASHRGMEEAVLGVGTAPYRASLLPASMAMMQGLFSRCEDIRRLGSAAWELCAIAAGRTEGFAEMMLSPWDFAAAGLILEEAGGKIAQFFLPQLDYTRVGPVVAGNAEVFDEMRAIGEGAYRSNPPED